MPGRWFEEFDPGDVLLHSEVVEVTQQDNAAFCRLTRNRQPLHLDEAFARTTPFGRVVVNGLYTMACAVGVSVEETTAGTLVANLGYEAVEHPAPVFPGDRLSFETHVVAVRPSSKPGRGVVTLEHHVRNQQGESVCRFRRIVLIRSRPSSTPEAPSESRHPQSQARPGPGGGA